MTGLGETVLLTGATGFLGRNLIGALLERDPALSIVGVIRARDDQELAERLDRLVASLSQSRRRRVQAVRGDVAAERLGLDGADYDRLVERVDRVFHCAASTRFDLPIADARGQNVESTRGLLALCRRLRRRGRRGRLDHVSTAFVAGRRRGLVGEDELSAAAGFRNTYERTKYEAEILCRDALAELPIVIHRPSIVVGRSDSGATTDYKTIYSPMKLLVKSYNLWPSVLNRLVPVPVWPDTRLDVVPVDWLSSAMAALFGQDSAEGQCVHLAAGPAASASVRELAVATCALFGTPQVRIHEPGAVLRGVARLVRPLVMHASPRTGAILDIMYDYGAGMPDFDTANAARLGLVAPRVIDYFQRLVRFASSTDYGRGRTRAAEPPAIADSSTAAPR